MHDHDCLGAGGDESLDGIRIDGRLLETDDIGEYGSRADCDGSVGGGHEVDRRLNDLVAVPNPQTQVRQVDRRSPTRDRKGMLDAEE